MNRKILCGLAAIALGATFGVATPAVAFHAGGFGGGMHGGGFGGMHGGGFGGMHGGFGGGFHRGMAGGRNFAVNRFNRFNRFAFNHRFFFHRRHFFAAPFVAFAGPYYYDDYCWRQVWTHYGWRWIYTCGYGY